MLVVKKGPSLIELLYAKHCPKHLTQPPHKVSIIISILHIKKKGPRTSPKSHSSLVTEQEPESMESSFRVHSINYYPIYICLFRKSLFPVS